MSESGGDSASTSSYRTLVIRHGRESVNRARMAASDQIELERYYKNLVTYFSIENASDSRWWATWLSSRDRFLSATWNELVALERLRTELADPGSHAVDFVARSLAAAHAARGLAKIYGLRVELQFATLVNLVWIEALSRVRSIARAVKVVVQTIQWIWLARMYGPRSDSVGDCRRILVTMLDANSTVAAEYSDRYFGKLHRMLEEHGLASAYCGNLQSPPSEVLPKLWKAGSESPVRVLTFGHFLKMRDVFVTLVRLLGHSVRIAGAPKFFGIDLSSIVRRDLMEQWHAVYHAMVLRSAAKTLLNCAPNADFIQIFENNPWERALYAEAKSRSPPRRVLGFLHCAVLPSHFKNFIAAEEWPLRPMPDAVACTGPAALAVLERLGHYPPGYLVPACDLRGPALDSLGNFRHFSPRGRMRLLVILEGLPTMWKALTWASAAAHMDPELRIHVREHPAMSVEEIARIAGRQVAEWENLTIERPAPLHESLARTDMVAYVSTTAAFYALYLGIPAVKLEIDDSVFDDPLFECLNLKRKVSSPQELVEAVALLSNMSEDEFAAESKAAARYVANYLRQPDDESIAPFILES